MAIAGVLVAGTGAAQAAMQIGTGLDSSGSLLGAYAADQNWTVTTTGPGNPTPTTTVSPNPLVWPNGVWPLQSGTWTPNQPNGQWISPVDTSAAWTQPSGVTANFSQAPNTMFYYTRTIGSGFTSISGGFSSDNPAALFLNGTQIAASAGWSQIPTDTYDWNKWTTFSDTLSPNQSYTITVEVYNLPGGAPGNPTGLLLAGAVTPVPEPTTMVAGIGAIGLVLAGMASRSRRSSAARIGK
jgi:hypothetical protein